MSIFFDPEIWNDLIGPLLLILLILATLWLILHQYQKTIARFMNLHLEPIPFRNQWQPYNHRLARIEPETDRSVSNKPATLKEAMQKRMARIRSATFVAFIVYVICGLIVNFVIDDDITSWSKAVDYSFIREQLYEWGAEFFLYPVIPLSIFAASSAIINVKPNISARFLLSFTGLALILSGLLEEEIDVNQLLIDSSDLGDFLFVMLAPVFLLFTLHRTIRALLIPFTLCIVLSLGFGMLPSVEDAGRIVASVLPSIMSEINQEIGSQLVGAIYFFMFLWVLSQILIGFSWLYEKGYVSELSLLAFCTLLIISIIHLFDTEADIATIPALIGILILWLSLTVGAYAITLHTISVPFSPPRTLLMLRVFSKDRSTERLLDVIQNRWRYAGPVLQVGGPDLAKINIDPYEMMKFLTFRAYELFLPGEISRTEIKKHLDLGPDCEGRFRINEVFCFESAWRSTVESLIDISDVILLDLRGFNPERAGTAYEMELLAQNNRLKRVIVVGNDETDWAYVDKLFKIPHRIGFHEVRLNVSEIKIEQKCFEKLALIVETQVNIN